LTFGVGQDPVPEQEHPLRPEIFADEQSESAIHFLARGVLARENVEYPPFEALDVDLRRELLSERVADQADSLGLHQHLRNVDEPGIAAWAAASEHEIDTPTRADHDTREQQLPPRGLHRESSCFR
jgi:hypothetical protein